MKYYLKILSSAAIICSVTMPMAADSYDWENPEIIGINKLPYHATLNLPTRKAENPEIKVLDGSWSFKWSPDPESRPADFWKDGYDVSGWDKITVPGLSDDLATASLDIDFYIRNAGKGTAKNLELSVKIGDKTLTRTIPAIKAAKEGVVTLSTTIDAPLLWSAEKPNLYPVEISLMADGKEIERLYTHTGFKKVEIRGNVLYVNNKPIKVRGVNRHEHHPMTGRYVDEATMRRDLELMKQGNVNLVRTSHYPDAPLWYELCDIYGIYVMDEANNETHDYGIGTTDFGDDPVWHDAMVDRAVALVERDKNHPCILFWSLGNESTAGANVDAMHQAILDIDATHPVYYDSDLSNSDIFDDAYASPARIEHMILTVKDKPVMMREQANHPSELTECGYINVNLDHKIQGVGGINSRGAQPLDQYLVDSHLPYTIQLTLSYQ